MGTARKLILTAFFICSFGKDTDARTKSFHRKVSYKIDSTSSLFMSQNWFDAFREANPHLFGEDSDFSDSDSENGEMKRLKKI